MTDLRDRLQKGVRGFEPTWRDPEDVRRSLAHRRHRSRVGAALLAGAVAIAGVGVTLSSLREISPTPASTLAPLDVGSLRLTWRADLQDASTFAGVLADARQLYLAEEGGIAAYPKDCSNPCSAAWRAPIPGAEDVLPRVELAVGEGVVFVTNRDSVYAFDTRCGSRGATCAPLWEAGLPDGGKIFAGLVAEGRFVRVMYTLGGGENDNGVIAAVYSADECLIESGSCQPARTADLGPGTIYSPGTVVDGVFYQQVGDHLTGIGSATCIETGGRCEPVFRVEALGDDRTQAGSLYGPAAAGDELIVASGDGNVYAYRPNCGAVCEPLWFGRAADYIEGQPVVAGDVVTVVVKSEVVAFPIGCRTDGGECEAEWRGPLDDNGPIEYADAQRVVVVDHLAKEGRISVFPTSCGDVCRPLWTASLPAEAQGVTGDGEHLFVGLRGGGLEAYPLECANRCLPVWTTTVDGADVWNVLVDDTGLYVGAGSGSATVGLGQQGVVLYGFHSAVA